VPFNKTYKKQIFMMFLGVFNWLQYCRLAEKNSLNEGISAAEGMNMITLKRIGGFHTLLTI
jgi:hypothetical protein